MTFVGKIQNEHRIEMSKDLKKEMPLKSDNHISRFLKKPTLKEELANYLLIKYSGDRLIQQGLLEVLSQSYQLDKSWKSSIVGYGIVPNDFRIFFTKITFNDCHLLRKRERHRNYLFQKVLTDSRGYNKRKQHK